MHLEIIGFCNERPIDGREDQIVIDQPVKGRDIAAELRLPKFRFPRLDNIIPFVHGFAACRRDQIARPAPSQ